MLAALLTQGEGFAEKGRQPLTKEAANFFSPSCGRPWKNVEKYETAK